MSHKYQSNVKGIRKTGELLQFYFEVESGEKVTDVWAQTTSDS
jgi:hypothetical protein